MPYPNKPTLIAMAMYALSEKAQVVPPPAEPVPVHPNRPKPQPPLWTALPSEAQAPYIKAAEFLLASTVGADLNHVNREKLAASIKAQGLLMGDVDDAVSLALNIHALL